MRRHVAARQLGLTLRARFPNPDGILLPGMFVRAVFTPAINNQAYLVPQQAVTRDPRGVATLYVITQDNKAERRTITADRSEFLGRLVAVIRVLRHRLVQLDRRRQLERVRARLHRRSS